MISDYQHPTPLHSYSKVVKRKKEEMFFLEKRIIKEEIKEVKRRKRGVLPLFLLCIVLVIMIIPESETEEEIVVKKNTDVTIRQAHRSLSSAIRKDVKKEYLSNKPKPAIKEEEKPSSSKRVQTQRPVIKDEAANEKEVIHNNEKMESNTPPPVKEKEEVITPPLESSFYLSGVHDISLPLGSSMDDLIFELTSGVSCSSSLSIDYETVNLSVPGNYSACYYPSGGDSICVNVSVQ